MIIMIATKMIFRKKGLISHLPIYGTGILLANIHARLCFVTVEEEDKSMEDKCGLIIKQGLNVASYDPECVRII